MSLEVHDIADHHTINEEEIMDEIGSEKDIDSYQPPFRMKALVAYLYFIQGVIFSMPMTMTLVYPKLPPYSVLAIFTTANFPFSIKFIIAPFIEKYTNLGYGKRKTWIILSQSTVSILVFIASFYTDQSYQAEMGFMMVTCVFCISLQDISLDAMAIKELKIPNLVGILQAIMMTLGIITGSVFLLKSTSAEFASNLGLSEPITHPSVIFRIISIFLVVPTIIVHLQYEETPLKSEKKIMKKKFFDIIKIYKNFFDFKSRFSLTLLILVTYIHGFTYFDAGYEYELIKSGFLKNTLNTITNASLVPISIGACILSSKIDATSEGNLCKLFLAYMGLKWALLAFVYTFFPTGDIEVALLYFSLQALQTMKFLLVSTYVNSFPVTGVSGMTITMLNSGSNLGNQKSLAMLMTGIFGWRNIAIIGLFLQLFSICYFQKFYKGAECAPCDIGIEMGEDSDGEHEGTDTGMMQEEDTGEDEDDIEFGIKKMSGNGYFFI